MIIRFGPFVINVGHIVSAYIDPRTGLAKITMTDGTVIAPTGEQGKRFGTFLNKVWPDPDVTTKNPNLVIVQNDPKVYTAGGN